MNTSNSFDKFDEHARLAFKYAQEEAQQYGVLYVGTEHLLLGLIRNEKSLACIILSNMSVAVADIRSALEFLLEGSKGTVLGEVGLTPRAKRVIALAIYEAKHLNSAFVGTEHLLAGVIREGEGIAAGVLESLGVTPKKVRTTTMHIQATTMPGLEQQPEASAGKEKPAEDTPTSTPKPGETPTIQTEATRPRHVAIVQTHSTRLYATLPFTEQSHKIIERAREEAISFSHNYIGTEHLLLGLLRDEEGVAGAVLQNLGLQLSRVRKSVEFIIGRGDRIVIGEIGLTPRSKKLVQLASDEAKRMQNSYVGTEHILLGMVAEGEGIAAGVLSSMGVELERVRAETQRVLQYAQREKP